MFRPSITRQAIKALNTSTRPSVFASSSSSLRLTFVRLLSSSIPRTKDNKKDPKNGFLESATTKARQGASGEQEGKYARTDEDIVIPYPDDAHMPAQPIVQGRGGMHFKRTLAQFSLENKVTVVTGGARGLGLVMAQAIVASGSDIAIVDLNSMFMAGAEIGGSNNWQRRRQKPRLRSWWTHSEERTLAWSST